jgi:hypothetical protein
MLESNSYLVVLTSRSHDLLSFIGIFNYFEDSSNGQLRCVVGVRGSSSKSIQAFSRASSDDALIVYIYLGPNFLSDGSPPSFISTDLGEPRHAISVRNLIVHCQSDSFSSYIHVHSIDMARVGSLSVPG